MGDRIWRCLKQLVRQWMAGAGMESARRKPPVGKNSHRLGAQKSRCGKDISAAASGIRPVPRAADKAQRSGSG